MPFVNAVQDRERQLVPLRGPQRGVQFRSAADSSAIAPAMPQQSLHGRSAQQPSTNTRPCRIDSARGEPARDPANQVIEHTQPPDRVYAMDYGHCTIVMGLSQP